MARRTVENFNGFVAARPSAASKKSTTPGRSKPVTAAIGNGKKNAPVSSLRAISTPAPPPVPTKKKDQQNVRPLAKVEKPQKNLTGKKIPVDVKTKHEIAKTKQAEIKAERNENNTNDKTVKSTLLDYSLTTSYNEEEYEDDFEDYESDFESDTSIDSLPPSPPTPIGRLTINDSNVAFTLPVGNTFLEEKLEPFLEEKFEIDSLERTIEIGLKNFRTAGKRKQEQEVKDKILTRGSVLMEMIKLDTVSYSLLEMPAIPYEQYIKIYGRSNTIQVYTQTHDDNAEKEVQTSEIELTEKWTQRPIILANGLNCSSPEYHSAKLGVGGTGTDRDHRLTRMATIDPNRVLAIGQIMLLMLNQQAMDQVERRLSTNNFDLGFSNGHLNPKVSAVQFLIKRPVMSVEFARITSITESLITTHEVMDTYLQYIICVWNVSNTEIPEYVLKCPNRVTSLCTIFKATSGFIIAAHIDGSICVWDLKESRLFHQQIDNLPCPLRSPSFNTALFADHGHRSTIVNLRTVTYSNVSSANEELPNEICCLDEDFRLTVWTIVDSWVDASEVSDQQSAGTAPWSSVRLVVMQSIEVNKNIPKYLSNGATVTCMCLNNNQDAFIGTNSGLVFRCNLGIQKVWPSYYICEYTDDNFSVNWLEICPFDEKYFLTAYSNGELVLYCANHREPQRRFVTFSSDSKAPVPITKIQWCTGYPGIVFGLDLHSGIHLWDLCDDVTTPMMSTSFRGKTVTSMSLTTKTQNTYMGLAFLDGAVEMHQVNLDNRKSAAAFNANNHGGDHSDLIASFLKKL